MGLGWILVRVQIRVRIQIRAAVPMIPNMGAWYPGNEGGVRYQQEKYAGYGGDSAQGA